ncbi:spectrin binding, partial [Trichomonas vaginalis G3]
MEWSLHAKFIKNAAYLNHLDEIYKQFSKHLDILQRINFFYYKSDPTIKRYELDSNELPEFLRLFPEKEDPQAYINYCQENGIIHSFDIYNYSSSKKIVVSRMKLHIDLSDLDIKESFNSFVVIHTIFLYYGSIKNALFSFHEIDVKYQPIIIDEIKNNNLIKDANLKKGSKTLLIYACENNFTELAMALLELPADYKIKDELGNTSIYYCIKNSNSLLVQNHFQYSIYLLDQNNSVSFPLDLALKSSDELIKTQVCKYFFHHKWNINDEGEKMKQYFKKASDEIKVELIHKSIEIFNSQYYSFFFENVDDQFIDKYDLLTYAYVNIVKPNESEGQIYALLYQLLIRNVSISKLTEAIIERKDVSFFKFLFSNNDKSKRKISDIIFSNGKTLRAVLSDLASEDKCYKEMLDSITSNFKITVSTWEIIEYQMATFRTLFEGDQNLIYQEFISEPMLFVIFNFLKSIYDGNTSQVLYCINNGMDVNIVFDGIHPIMLCNDLEMLKLLIEKGSNFAQKISLTVSPSTVLGMEWFNPEHIIDSESNYYVEYYPVHAIVRYCNHEMLNYCVSCGLKLNILDSQNNTLMHHAAVRDSKIDPNASMIKYLFKKKLSIKTENIDGILPIHFALIKNPAAAKFLIENRADLGAKDRYGEIPLHYAVAYSTPEIVDLLLSKKRNYDICNNNLQYPINAIKYQTNTRTIIQILQVFVNHGASLDLPSYYDGDTIIFKYLKNYEVLRFLIDNGADLNHTNYKVGTPLSECIITDNYVG